MKSLVICTLSVPASCLNDVERAQDDAFGLLDPRARRRAQADAQQRSVGIRETIRFPCAAAAQ